MMKPSGEIFQSADDAARRAAKTLLRAERHGALATLDADTAGPMASRISVATASDGAPIFLISQLSAHFSALEADPRASLLLGTPGKGDPLAHVRITVNGAAARLDGAARDHARARFLARHPKAALYADFGDFAFWRLNVDSALLNGGFGKAYKLTADDLLSPSLSELEAHEAGAVEHMNDDHADAVALYAEQLLDRSAGGWKLACVDAEGLDLVRGNDVARLWFDTPLQSAEALRPMLVTLAKRAQAKRDRTQRDQ
ncbi:MAG: DUF2470 domain-containing protein [Neomegalonema sp.]|nr:DUF2470 domain-containing protein [Neomegalonema sp.]